MRVRLSREERKNHIKEISRSIFIEKGISNTTMKDIIEATGLSVGGMYHYYKNPLEIFYEIMEDGNRERFKLVSKILAVENVDRQASLKTFEDKIINDTESGKLYSIFLAETITNKDLEDIYLRLMEEGIEEFNALTREAKFDFELTMNEFNLAILNSLIVGYQIIGNHKVFKDNRQRFRKILNFIFFDKEEDK